MGMREWVEREMETKRKGLSESVKRELETDRRGVGWREKWRQKEGGVK